MVVARVEVPATFKKPLTEKFNAVEVPTDRLATYRLVVEAFVTTRLVIVDDADVRFAIYAFVVEEFVSNASVRVDDAATNRVIYESVDVAALAKRYAIYALVVVEFVSTEDEAVSEFMFTEFVKFAGSVKVEKPEKEALENVGDSRWRFVAVPPEIVGKSIVTSLRYEIVETPIGTDGDEYVGTIYDPYPGCVGVESNNVIPLIPFLPSCPFAPAGPGTGT